MKIERIARHDADDETEVSLAELLQLWRGVIAKHKRIIFLLTVLVGAIAVLVASSLTPMYRAAATLLIEPNKANVVSIEEVYTGVGASRDHIQTQAEIVRSRALIAKLVRRLDLATHPALVPARRTGAAPAEASWIDHLLEGWTGPEPVASPEARVENAIGGVTRALEVRPVRNSHLIRIEYESHDAAFAAKVANGLSELYIENDLEGRAQMTQKVAVWLTGRLSKLRENLEASERALQRFRDKEKIVDSKGVALGTSRQLEEMSSSVVAARQKVAELENSYNQIQAALRGQSGHALTSIPAVLRNPTVIKLRELENEAERRLIEVSKRYGTEHPRRRAAEGDLQAARESTARAVNNVVASITREYEVAKATEQSLTAALNRTKAEIMDINRKGFELATLEREVQTNRQLYDMFFSRFKETNAAGDMQSGVARVIDPAIVPLKPVRPRKTVIVVGALVIGLILSVMLAFVLEHLDNTVRTGADVETKLQSPLLGLLPLVRRRRGKFEIRRAFAENKDPAFGEAVRTLRTGVLMSALDGQQRIILVTSALPGEGKTSVATNLALALAQLKRTCLIDADMRRPKLASVLGIDPAAPGLSQLITGTEPPERCVHEYGDTGLIVVPSGPVPPNPLEVLSSRRFQEVLGRLEKSFDMVVVDSPPVQLVSDAVVLAGIANALVFVVRADATPYPVARGGIEILGRGRARMLGVVLNQIDLDGASRYYGYGGTYGTYKGYSDYGTEKQA